MSNSTEDEVRSDVKLRTLPRTAYAYPSYVHPEVLSSQANDVFWCLVALRLANALTITTFFQPDEYYQSLEPAWATAFGPNSGAWLTWVRHYKFEIFCTSINFVPRNGSINSDHLCIQSFSPLSITCLQSCHSDLTCRLPCEQSCSLLYQR